MKLYIFSHNEHYFGGCGWHGVVVAENSLNAAMLLMSEDNRIKLDTDEAEEYDIISDVYTTEKVLSYAYWNIE